MAGETRKVRAKVRMKEVPLAAVKDDLSRYLREAERGEIVIERDGISDLNHPVNVVRAVRSARLQPRRT